MTEFVSSHLTLMVLAIQIIGCVLAAAILPRVRRRQAQKGVQP